MFGRARNHFILWHARTFASRHGPPPPRKLDFQSRQPGNSYRGNRPPGKSALVRDRNKDDYFPERVPRNHPPSTGRISRKYDKEQDVAAYGTGGWQPRDGYEKDRLISSPPTSHSSTPEYEYIYGHSSVLLALRQARRKPLTLLMQHMVKENGNKKDKGIIQAIRDAARYANVPIILTDKGELNNITDSRPHQGVVLKATPLTPTMITHLTAYTNGSHTAEGDAGPAHRFERANGRAPVWVALDEVQDPQRYFVSQLLITRNIVAPLSAVVSKVSAGAMEVMTVFSTRKLLGFLKATQSHGWKVIGTCATDSTQNQPVPTTFDTAPTSSPTVMPIPSPSHHLVLSQLASLLDPSKPSPLAGKPLVLVLGNEATGLRTNVRNCCDYTVEIPGRTEVAGGEDREVESLNVGVAAGVVMSWVVGRNWTGA
ncbi:Alpha/beta knot methyltransferase [Endogone sp. FLAS-F59071]|nr:Alpha/beta knot methyltransferase [Endogone sp. FLAS-F59071]|eukprot:RUS22992.1 Alpha/beta knot methyltransferase [Endogone sp. FLAS-F59071]